jgi:hypothetical protein
MRSRPKGRTAEMGLYIGRLQYVSPTKGKRHAVMTQKHLDQAGAGERAIPMRREPTHLRYKAAFAGRLHSSSRLIV